MSDLIERQDAIATAVRAAIDWHKLANPQYSIAYCIGEAMRQLPSAEPERKTGRWIHIRTEPDGNALYECSECHKGEVHVPIVEVHYCWNCGARMDGGSE